VGLWEDSFGCVKEWTGRGGREELERSTWELNRVTGVER